MSDSITRLQLGDRTFILVGTAHISKQSVEEVERIISEERPERVCIEIDPSRYRTLTEGAQWSSLDIYRVLKEGKGFLLLSNLVLTSFQRRLGLELGIRPGEEMLAAIRTAESLGIPTALCDRDIQVTLRRAWARSSFWGKNKLLAALLSSVLSSEKLSSQQIEELKKKNELESMMEELAGYLPSVKEVLIDERDQYLAQNIYHQPEKKILAVVGAGHVPGIIQWLEVLFRGETRIDVRELETVPPPAKVSKFLPWVLPALIIGLIGWGFLRSGWIQGMEMVWVWVLVNGGLAALGSLLALAHPVTILASFPAAPIATLNPAIGVGMITGLIEAYFRKPTVEDFERLSEDITSLKGFFRNRVTHVLLVFFFSNIGGMIGNFIALPYLTVLARK
ncbi:MAG: TraB/GumN family protein [Spirochaetes bacterium]|nr:TraB/GumN family protein [Spirochaetota bacterium]